MLFLLLQVGNDRYVLPTGEVVEVLPLVDVKAIPHAPCWVSGVFNYHGCPIPLIDLTQLMAERPSRRWLSTRIIVVNVAVGNSERHTLGLLGESVMETIRLADQDFFATGVTPAGTPYLGPVATVHGCLVQRLEARALVNDDIRNLLFHDRIT